jgi:hypothetical protein
LFIVIASNLSKEKGRKNKSVSEKEAENWRQ